ncbi:DUF4856 domain-containing protein [Flavobacterium sp. ASW18X]|uniref:DUF4856 domain-containing protein n=1 Tax=Flavobacterium sp. ASW18X TaxID=2572595 RepID=UPI0010AE3C02|nr:DUF4856 domain-containing protein [Flavobacterium sp. ASW18X]TKD61343.1 DUF4856 domain-containing protein [Flavobacterium sp. ASW18X]
MIRKILPVVVGLSAFTSCSLDDDGDDVIIDEIQIENPASYTFKRDGESTVSFSGQTTRLDMGDELLAKMMDPTSTLDALQAMYAHEEGAADFTDADLNASDKNLITKTAASVDYFAANTAEQNEIRADFNSWLQVQVEEVFPNWNSVATAGVAGQLADGSSTRYVNAQGLEMNQLFNKSLIGALMVDQAINNYLSTAVLDAGDNPDNNGAGITEDGKNYTTMEHKWDEAYGYVFGQNADAANPNADLGADNFLNKYLGRVEGDEDFAGIADDIFQAFKLGRAAIVAKQYTVRDQQAELIQDKISTIIGVRAVYYLQQAKLELEKDSPAYGTVFHDLSEGYGFVYSLQFTRDTSKQSPYFNKEQVDEMLAQLLGDGTNGLWDVTPETLDALSETIANAFSFTLEEAAN